MIVAQDFIDLFRIGLKPIPLEWNAETKTATSHCIAHGDVTDDNYTDRTFSDFVKTLDRVNGIAIKLFSPFGCIDFDLKNTDDKTIFDQWLKGVDMINSDILSKICIERTRNNGYHVYIKYSKIKNKVTFAQETKGQEVIALYTGGTLSYCDPTPGYSMFHNTFEDLEELTDDEYDVLLSCSIYFNKYEADSFEGGSRIITEYPTHYENLCLQFDQNITDDAFEIIINDIDLFRTVDYKYNKKDKHIAFLRKGSKAKYSAKVYFHSKKLLIFSASVTGFPHWGNRKSQDDHDWVLTPTKIIYHKNDCDWTATIEEISAISESIGIEIIEQKPVTNHDVITKGRLKFPYDIFPQHIQDFIAYHPFQNEYIAGSFLTALSTVVGNSCTLIANDGYFVKPILYLAVVAPPGASKTPALKSVYNYLEKIDSSYYKQYEAEKESYKQDLAFYKNQKKGDGVEEPTQPVLKQLLIKDSTIEMVVKILSTNIDGCCILADELSGFLKRMGRYGDNDEVQKWLELWSGSPVLLQRISRDENKVENPFCSIFGGIQPGVLESLSSKENEHNGFYHRFLFIYPEMDPKKNWGKYEIPQYVKDSIQSTFINLMMKRGENQYYRLDDEADRMYGEWFNHKNKKYNSATEDNVKGIIAKYQDYCLRFALLLHVSHNYEDHGRMVSGVSMERAIRLTEYFLGNMYKSMKVLAPESPVDKVTGNNLKFFKALPPSFTNKTAITIAKEFNIKDNNCRVLLTRWSGNKDNLLSKSGEQKNTTYTKIYE